MYHQKHHQYRSQYNHKFGFHINGPRQDAFDEVFRIQPKVIKTLDFSVDIMKRIRQEIPDVFLIGRLYVQPQDFGQLSGHTSRAARQKGIELADRILREEVNQDLHHLKGRPLINAWESLNEVFPEWTDKDTQKLYDDFQVAFGQKMLAAGFEPVAFNFGQGNGRGQQWLRLYPGTLDLYTYLGFHEYDWPTMDRLHKIGLDGPAEPHNLVPGVGEGRGNDGMWRCLRYRRIMNEGIRQNFGDKHTVIITECGMTQAVWGGPSGDLGPWARDLTVPATIPGGVVPSPIPVDDYWQSLRWYNDELMKDDYVIGACLFVTGAAGKPEWSTFEHLGPITDRIFAFQAEVSAEDRPAPPPPPPPEPPPLTPTPEPPGPAWTFSLETGPGLGLLVGDIGLADEQIIVERPDGSQAQVTSGSKSEFGPGGFETYAQMPGVYTLKFLDQSFELTLSGQFTKVTFEQVKTPDPLPQPEPDPAPAPPPPEEPAPSPDPAPDTSSPPTPPPEPGSPEWAYTIETGPGLGLLVGDIGLADERISVARPDGSQAQVTSGSKPEFGPGGFETYAQMPGVYTLKFLDQSFALTLSGQFTKVNFKRLATPTPDPQPQPAPAPSPPSTPHTPEPEPTPTLPPAEPTPARPVEPAWTFTLETGPGLGLLVGDIGLADVPITIQKPDGTRNQVTSGRKPEFGVGGFETYAQTPGDYTLTFLDQRFELPLTGQFTKVVFNKVTVFEAVSTATVFPAAEVAVAPEAPTQVSDEPRVPTPAHASGEAKQVAPLEKLIRYILGLFKLR